MDPSYYRHGCTHEQTSPISNSHQPMFQQLDHQAQKRSASSLDQQQLTNINSTDFCKARHVLTGHVDSMYNSTAVGQLTFNASSSQGQVVVNSEHGLIRLATICAVPETIHATTSDKPTAADTITSIDSAVNNSYLHFPGPKCNIQPYLRSFKCGGCGLEYDTTCKLHDHLQGHGTDGSYFYDSCLKTAFPKYGTSCKITQTDSHLLPGLSGEPRESLASQSLILKQESGDTSTTIPMASKHGKQEKENEDLENNCFVMFERLPETKHKVLLDHFEEIDEDVSENELNDSVKEDFYNDNDNMEDDSKNVLKTDSKKYQKKKRKKHPMKVTISLNQNKVLKSKRTGRLRKKLLGNEEKKNMNSKKQDKGISRKCQYCSAEFPSMFAMRIHKNAEHRDMLIRCDFCGKMLRSKSGMKRHILIHVGLAPFDCDMCEKKYRSLAELNVHKLTHSEEKNYICQYCGQAFATSSFLRQHIKRCLDIRPFECLIPGCEKKFRCKHSLMMHERCHTGEKPFICEVCGTGFARSDKLVKHTHIHTGEKPFQCDRCPKSFSTKDHLQRHMRIHTQEMPFSCNHCGKSFAQNWNLKAHTRQHTGEKPYTCDVCGLGFTHNVSRKNHMKSHCNT